MANTFKRYTSASIGTGATTVYTVPSATTAIVLGFNLSNRVATSVTADCQVAGIYIVKGVPLPSNSGLSVLDGKMILEAGDTVVVTGNTASSVDVILSVMEES